TAGCRPKGSYIKSIGDSSSAWINPDQQQELRFSSVAATGSTGNVGSLPEFLRIEPPLIPRVPRGLLYDRMPSLGSFRLEAAKPPAPMAAATIPNHIRMVAVIWPLDWASLRAAFC